MTLAHLLRDGLVRRPRASARPFLGQGEVVVRPARDRAMLLAWVRAPEDHTASLVVGDARSMLCIDQSAEDTVPLNRGAS